MGGAESMSERRPGVPRLRHGAGVGVGHVCAEGTVHGPIVLVLGSRLPAATQSSRTQKFGKKELRNYGTLQVGNPGASGG